MKDHETARWRCHTRVDKFVAGALVETVEVEDNTLLTDGVNALFLALVGNGGTPFDAGNTYLAVGNGADADDPARTDLAGEQTVRVAIDEAPVVEGNQLSVKATYDTGTANFDWREWGIVNAPDGGVMLNRRVRDLGTKVDNATWTLTVTVSIS